MGRNCVHCTVGLVEVRGRFKKMLVEDLYLGIKSLDLH